MKREQREDLRVMTEAEVESNDFCGWLREMNFRPVDVTDGPCVITSRILTARRVNRLWSVWCRVAQLYDKRAITPDRSEEHLSAFFYYAQAMFNTVQFLTKQSSQADSLTQLTSSEIEDIRECVNSILNNMASGLAWRRICSPLKKRLLKREETAILRLLKAVLSEEELGKLKIHILRMEGYHKTKEILENVSALPPDTVYLKSDLTYTELESVKILLETCLDEGTDPNPFPQDVIFDFKV